MTNQEARIEAVLEAAKEYIDHYRENVPEIDAPAKEWGDFRIQQELHRLVLHDAVEAWEGE